MNRFVAGERLADVRGLIKGVLRRHFKVGNLWCALGRFTWLVTFDGKEL